MPPRIHIPETDDALLGECDQETYRSSGPGGQNVNKRETAVRLRHRPTCIVVSSQEERSQYMNRKRCLEKLRRAVESRNRRRKRRVPTSKPRSVDEKRLKKKARRSEKKELRKPPSRDG